MLLIYVTIENKDRDIQIDRFIHLAALDATSDIQPDGCYTTYKKEHFMIRIVWFIG